ncbi:DapH/DapD/GlmU-related protein [Salinibacter ruber]|uniref:acyltransferase n=1 Tax=Salinibacter ruber TaxID=146919 RepID=UPI0023431662
MDTGVSPPAPKDHAETIKAGAAAPSTIEDDVFVGTGALVLKGMTIGEGAVVGAGSAVTQDVPPHRGGGQASERGGSLSETVRQQRWEHRDRVLSECAGSIATECFQSALGTQRNPVAGVLTGRRRTAPVQPGSDERC